MNFPVFSQLAGNSGFPETGSLETASSSGESANHRFLVFNNLVMYDHFHRGASQLELFLQQPLPGRTSDRPVGYGAVALLSLEWQGFFTSRTLGYCLALFGCPYRLIRERGIRIRFRTGIVKPTRLTLIGHSSKPAVFRRQNAQQNERLRWLRDFGQSPKSRRPRRRQSRHSMVEDPALWC